MTKMNRLNDADLINVAGGTVGELDGLVSACAKNPVLKTLAGAGTHVPGFNIKVAKLMEEQLAKMGIKADISVGWGGTGVNSKHNTYFDTVANRNLSQIEVEERLEKYAI